MESGAEFQGKVVLVTGSAQGIGAASAIAFAEQGADVALLDLSPMVGTADRIRSLGRRVVEIQGDAADYDVNELAVGRSVGELGGLDIFVAAATYSDRQPFHLQPLEEAQRTINVSMWGYFFGLRAATRYWIERGRGGSAVLVGSPHSYIPFPDCMAYNMAKGAVDIMGKSAATELVSHGIRVNIVHPGWTDTPGERKFYTEQNLVDAARKVPLGRLGRPEEVARGVLFLASDRSEYINGTILAIDGGIQLPWEKRV